MLDISSFKESNITKFFLITNWTCCHIIRKALAFLVKCIFLFICLLTMTFLLLKDWYMCHIDKTRAISLFVESS